jgi:hypothetical protein
VCRAPSAGGMPGATHLQRRRRRDSARSHGACLAIPKPSRGLLDGCRGRLPVSASHFAIRLKCRGCSREIGRLRGNGDGRTSWLAWTALRSSSSARGEWAAAGVVGVERTPRGGGRVGEVAAITPFELGGVEYRLVSLSFSQSAEKLGLLGGGHYPAHFDQDSARQKIQRH